MRHIIVPALLGASLIALCPALARAQSVPDIQDLVVQGEQVNRTVQSATAEAAPAIALDDGTVDGEAGVYVMQLNRIFSVSASAGLGFTDNPTRTSDDPGTSFYADAALSAGVATRLGEKVDFSLSATVAGREFFKDRGPSNRTLSGVMALGAPIAGTPLYVGLVGFGGFSYDQSFRNPVSFYGLSGNVSAAFPLSRKTAVRPGIGITRQFSGTQENNSVTLSGSVDLFTTFTPRLTGNLRLGVSRRWYDDFYEDVTFLERRDWLFQAGATLAYRVSDKLRIGLTAGAERQKSTFYLSDYKAVDASAALSLRLAF